MENVIVVLIILAIVSVILRYLVRLKKRSESCVGCPYAKQCAGGCSYGREDFDNVEIHD